MRFKLTIVLALLNALVFGAIFYLERDEEPAASRSEPILSPRIREATRITIDGEAIDQPRVLMREEGYWKVQAPHLWRGNRFAVERMMESLLLLRRQVGFPVSDLARNNQSLADYGLEVPDLVITFEGPGLEQTLRVGAPTDVGSRYYLLSPDQTTIYVVGEDVFRSLAMDFREMNDPRLFGLDFFEVSALTITPGGGRNLKIRIIATEDGWNFESPIRTQASAASVDARLQQALGARVLGFPEEGRLEAVGTGLSNPRLRLTLEAGQRRETLLLGDRIPGSQEVDENDAVHLAYAQVEGFPTLLAVEEGRFTDFLEAQENMRERAFFQFDPLSLTGLSLRGESGQTVNLQRLESGEWQALGVDRAGEAVRYAADPGILQQIVGVLLNLRASRFINDAPSESDLTNLGLQEPQRHLTLSLSTGTRSLLLGSIDPERRGVYVKSGEQPFIYLVPLSILTHLPTETLDFRHRMLEKMPETAVLKSISVTDLQNNTVIFERNRHRDGESWEESGEDDPDRQIAFAALVRQLKNFQTGTFLTDSFTAGYTSTTGETHPWRFKITAVFQLPGGADGSVTDERIYHLTERIDGSLQAGGSRRFNTTFNLPQAFIDHWEVLFPSRPTPPEMEMVDTPPTADETSPAEEAAGEENPG